MADFEGTPLGSDDSEAVLAAIVSKGFRIIKNPAFEKLHPRGGDGRFIDKHAKVTWIDPQSKLHDSGEVAEIIDAEHVKVVNRRGVAQIVSPKQLFQSVRSVAKIDPKTMNRTDGRQHGSNVGEVMTDKDTGVRRYVKTPRSKEHVSSEILTHRLYQRGGAAVPDVAMSPDGTKFITKLEESAGWKDLSPQDLADSREEIQKNFIFDAWLGNWDAPANDNIRVNKDGVALRVDTGGALDYRAQGAPKPSLLAKGRLDHDVSELNSLRGAKNHAGKQLYKGLTKEQEKAGMERLLAISPDRIREDVEESGLPSRLADDLIARRAWMANYYGLELPEETEAGKKWVEARRAAKKAEREGAQATPETKDGAKSDDAAPTPDAPADKVDAVDAPKEDAKPETKADETAPKPDVVDAQPEAKPAASPEPAAEAKPDDASAPDAPEPAKAAEPETDTPKAETPDTAAKPETANLDGMQPGSKVWLKDKPDGIGKYEDTWDVVSVSRDGSSVTIKNDHRKLTVEPKSLRPLRDNGASPRSEYGNGGQVNVGDAVTWKDGRRGKIVEVFPMHVAAVPDGSSKKEIIRARRLHKAEDAPEAKKADEQAPETSKTEDAPKKLEAPTADETVKAAEDGARQVDEDAKKREQETGIPRKDGESATAYMNRTADAATEKSQTETLEKQAEKLKDGKYADTDTRTNSQVVADEAAKVKAEEPAPVDPAKLKTVADLFDALDAPTPPTSKPKSAVTEEERARVNDALAALRTSQDQSYTNLRAGKDAADIRKLREETEAREKAEREKQEAQKAENRRAMAERNAKTVAEAAQRVEDRRKADAEALKVRAEQAKQDKVAHDATRDEINADIRKVAEEKAAAEKKAAEEKAAADKAEAEKKAAEQAEASRKAAEAKAAAQAAAKAVSGNPEGEPFDFANHDFTANPAPEAYSLTYDMSLPVLMVPNSKKAVVVFPDGTTGEVPTDTLRKVDTVDAEGLKAKRAADAAAAAAKAAKKTASTKKLTKKEQEQQDIDNMTVDEAKALPNEKISVKYPTINGANYELRPGDSLYELKGPKRFGYGAAYYERGIFLVRDGKVHRLGSNLQNNAPSFRVSADDTMPLDELVTSLGVAPVDKIANLTPPKYAKAAQLLHPELGEDGLGLSKKELTVSLQGGKTIEVPVDKVTAEAKTYVFENSAVRGGGKMPVFVHANRKDINSDVYFVGTREDMYVSSPGDTILDGKDWVKLTPEQKSFYFEEWTGYNNTPQLGVRNQYDAKRKKESLTPTAAQGVTLPDGSTLQLPSNRGSMNWRELETALEGAGARNRLLSNKDRAAKVALNPTVTPRASSAAAKVAPGQVLEAPKVEEKKVGEVADGHLQPHLGNKLTPAEILRYKLPSTREKLNDGGQDSDLLNLVLRHGNIEKSSKEGHMRQVEIADDGTQHKDPLMYEYGRDMAADEVPVKMTATQIKAYAKENGMPILYRGVGMNTDTTTAYKMANDFRDGPKFGGTGINGSGDYTTENARYALQYAGNRTATRTVLTPKRGASIIDKVNASREHITDMGAASDERLKHLEKLGVVPTAAQVADPTVEQTLSDVGKSRVANAFDLLSQSPTMPDKERAAQQAFRNKVAAYVSFYEGKGFKAENVDVMAGYYSGAHRAVLHFTPTNGDGSSKGFEVTMDRLSSVDEFGRNTQTNPNATLSDIVNFNGDMETTYGKYNTGAARFTGRRWGLAASPVSQAIFRDGFSHPIQVQQFIEQVNPKYAGTKLVDVPDPSSPISTPLDPASIPHFDELAPALGASARLVYIQDIGRWVQAAGYDILRLKHGGDIHYIFSNRNAMVQQKYDKL